jgi:putative FmdB family regulatory protein
MPTYEYACSACGNQWEQVQRIVEAPIEVCPKCSAKAAHRLISGGTNFILKGGGWYSDLYSSSKPSKDAGSSGSGGSGTGSESKGDASGSSSGTKSETAAASTSPSTGTGTSTPSSAPSS